jgi:hypothetical protein
MASKAGEERERSGLAIIRRVPFAPDVVAALLAAGHDVPRAEREARRVARLLFLAGQRPGLAGRGLEFEALNTRSRWRERYDWDVAERMFGWARQMAA